MIRRIFGRLAWQAILASVVVLGFALPAAAQGRISGTVVDAKGQPVADAKVTLEEQYGGAKKFETKTDKKGEFAQVGVVDRDPLGGKSESVFKVTAVTKDGSATTSTRVSIGTAPVVHLVIVPGAPVAAAATSGGGSKADQAAAAKAAEGRKAFDTGVEFVRAAKYDDAVEAFNKALAANPQCQDCYFNIGLSYAQKKDYAKAEDNYKKAIELKADYADAYSNLATIYNTQRKFDLAAAASAKASALNVAAGATGGNADSIYAEGVILWNTGKIPEAKAKFQAALAANPNHAESHYQLGMSLVNEGKLADAGAEFNAYLKLAPDGPNAATAKALVAQLPK